MKNFEVVIVSDTISRIVISGNSGGNQDASQGGSTEVHAQRIIQLIGTAHVSAESAREVRDTIHSEKPDRLCVEIDQGRLSSLDNGRKWSNTDLRRVIRSKQGFMMMANLALNAFQQRVGADAGLIPGGEMKIAVDTARELGIPFSCCDRPVQITLNRAWRKSGLWSRMKLVSSLIFSVFGKESTSVAEIEELKKSDGMQHLMKELAETLPAVKTVLIDERDFYLASRILESEGQNIIAVVGAAHVQGIVNIMRKIVVENQSTDTSAIAVTSPAGWYTRLLPWLVPAIILGLFTLGIVRQGFPWLFEKGIVWILVNGILAAAGAIIALAHPVTVIGSFLAAPITSLIPTIGVGMVSGLLEYTFSKPRVGDMESLSQAVLTWKGWYRNRISHILLVFFFSSLGSMAGTFIGAFVTGLFKVAS